MANVVTSTPNLKEIQSTRTFSHPNLNHLPPYLQHIAVKYLVTRFVSHLRVFLHFIRQGGIFTAFVQVVQIHAMAGSSLTYFTCTLGQAAITENLASSNTKTINDFLESQAQLYPKFPAVGFPVPVPNEGEWRSEVFCRFPLLRQNLTIDAS